MQRICVFCGSSAGVDEIYAEAARGLGRALVERGIGLVYGGGRVGLMGEISDSVLDAGGEAIGVMPKALVEREISHQGFTELHVVDTMHEQKALMNDLAAGFFRYKNERHEHRALEQHTQERAYAVSDGGQ